MQRAIILFIVVVVGLELAASVAVHLAGEELGQSLAMIPGLVSIVVPLVMAYIAHRVSGGAGNPFRGLAFGSGGTIVLTWLCGLAAGLVALAICVLLGLCSFDLEMTDYIAMIEEQAAKSGQPSGGAEAAGIYRITGYATLGAAPTIGAAFAAALLTFFTLPWFGWLGRRLLVKSRASASLILLALFAVRGAAAGLLFAPQWDELSLPLRMLVGLAGSACAFPALWWLFLRFRSAVIPALGLAVFTSTAQGMLPIISDANQLFAPPSGLLVSLVSFFVGLALWVWKDPGGSELAVAAVAHDGTPLTPADLKQLELMEREAREMRMQEQNAPAAVPPPPPLPPDSTEPPAGS